MSFFTVIIPLYNKEKYIENALKSILFQTYSNLEVIVVNDGSTDNSASIINSFVLTNNVKYYTNPENVGISKTRNIALSYCLGHYIALLDSDDICAPNRIENQVKFLTKNIGYKAVSSWMQEFDKNTLNLYRNYHDFETLKSRALVYAELNSIELAIADLDICLRPDANDTSIWMSKGNIFYDAQRFSEAIDAYNVILLLYPENKSALYNRADAYTSLKRYDEAIRDYQILSSKDKYNSEYYFNIGFCYLQQGKNQESILSFGKALDTDYSNLGLLLMLRGVAYNNLKLQGEACSDWQKAVELGYKDAQKYRIDFCK
jgi:glycosyltransferase involved in cell wall biosynthesis